MIVGQGSSCTSCGAANPELALRHRDEREEYGLEVKTAELAKDDNLQPPQPAAQIVGAFGQLHDKGLIGMRICWMCVTGSRGNWWMSGAVLERARAMIAV